MLLAGVLVGLPAALFGLLDWLGITSASRAKAVGLWHGLGNALVLALFAASAWLRWQLGPTADFPSTAHYLSLAGAAILLVTGWLGGELVYRHGIGVEAGGKQSNHG